MDYFQLQEFIAQAYPGKAVSYNFTPNCVRIYEITMTDGKSNAQHHIEYRKVEVSIEGMAPILYPILPHRATVDLDHMRSILSENILKA